MTPPSLECENHLRRHLANPFLVLELSCRATRDEVERQGAKLLALLAAAVESARSYSTPLGVRERTPEMVRSALAELRDPERRLVHEWWAAGFTASAPPE
jgi:hypothetical protein